MNTAGKYDDFFKAYDVRGTIPQIDERLFYLIGKGLVETILIPENLPTSINVTYDIREKSELFSRYLVQGVVDAGGSVTYLGLASTELLYAACVMDGNPGVQLTASHNPREYHGLKIVKKAPQMVGMESGLASIRDYVNENINLEIPELTELVGVDQSGRQAVKEFLLSKVEEVGSTALVNAQLKLTGRTIRIVADCGNGAAGVFMPWLVEMYPSVEFIPLFWEPDGTFPNHPANPQDYANLKDLQKAVAEHKADFGVAFDGDGDRAALVDEQGIPVKGDFLVSAFTEAYLDEYKVNKEWQALYNPVIATIQPNSRCVWETIGEKDGVGVICKQGHTFVKEAMGKYNGLYGGEYSNHHYFGQLKGMDAGSLPLALFLKLYVVGEYEKASHMFDKWSSSYFITELINLAIPAGVTWSDWKRKLEIAFADGTQSEFDGFAVYYPDWKFSMRPSNTEPVVRFVLETKGKDYTKSRVKQIEDILGIVA